MKNKNIVITGASQGLGYDLSRIFSKEGSRLFLISSNKKKLIHLKKNCFYKNKHKFFDHDLSDPKKISILTNEIKIFFKNKIDVVIHSAGGGLGLKAVDINNQDLLKVMNINILSSIEFNSQILPLMQKRKKGNIVHIGSIAANEAVGSLSYNIAKSILKTYVRTAGNQMAKYNIIITGVSPGGFISKNNAMARLKKKNLYDYQKFIKERLPRGVMGKTSELIPLIKFLCSDMAGMASGCMLTMDGGEGKSY